MQSNSKLKEPNQFAPYPLSYSDKLKDPDTGMLWIEPVTYNGKTYERDYIQTAMDKGLIPKTQIVPDLQLKQEIEYAIKLNQVAIEARKKVAEANCISSIKGGDFVVILNDLESKIKTLNSLLDRLIATKTNENSSAVKEVKANTQSIKEKEIKANLQVKDKPFQPVAPSSSSASTSTPTQDISSMRKKRIKLRRSTQYPFSDDDVQNSFFVAVKDQKSETVKLCLTSSHVNIHKKDKAGNTALHIAANNQDIDTVLALLKAGADPWAKNGTSKTPVDLTSNYRLHRILLEAQAERCTLSFFKTQQIKEKVEGRKPVFLLNPKRQQFVESVMVKTENKLGKRSTF